MADLGSTRVYGDLTVSRSLTVAGRNVEDALDERALLTDARFTDAREWTASEVTQAEAEAGTSTTSRKWTAQRVRQAIAAWWAGSAEKTKLDGIQAGAQVNVATNLAYTTAASNGVVTSSTGTNATLPAATTTLAGLMTGADKTKLDGIAAGAQVNVPTNLGYTSSTRTLTSSTGSNVVLPQVSTSVDGLMIASDKVKLNGLSNVNLTGGTNVTVSGTYPNLTISSTDTNTTYSAGTGISLTGTTFSLSGEEFTSALLTKLNGIQAGAQVNVGTNLGYTTAATTGTVTSSTGTNVVLPAATTSLAGLMTGADKTKLDGAAAASHTHDANEITTGVLAPARLGTGTANTTTYLRGDGTWQVVTSGAIYTQGTGISIENNQISLATTIGGGPYTFTGNVSAANSVPADALCTGFISFAGNPVTIRSSFGCITSITRVSAGVYDLTLTGLNNANYVVAGFARGSSGVALVSQLTGYAFTSTTLRICVTGTNNSGFDSTNATLLIFGGK